MADSAYPAAPETPNGADGASVTQPPVPGVLDVYGAETLVIDVSGSGHATLQPLAWNNVARLWFAVGPPITTTASFDERYLVTGWASRYAYVAVSGLTGTVNVWLGTIIDEGRN